MIDAESAIHIAKYTYTAIIRINKQNLFRGEKLKSSSTVSIVFSLPRPPTQFFFRFFPFSASCSLTQCFLMNISVEGGH
ncbi:hypothetical protein AAHA92_24185 [Salvia divinorum]|uniref:Uncharacterized protein n=1 Tax=Salvia divinorum TaxID=28513 RepID=A0ABD1G6J0_SALDI